MRGVILKMLFISTRIATEYGEFDGGMEVKDGIIKSFIPRNKLTEEHVNQAIDFKKNRLLPGMIELHIHGYMGWIVNSDDMDQCQHLCDALLTSGVTSFLPTTHLNVQDSLRINPVWSKLKENQLSGSRILGISMEGPFINPKTLHFQKHIDAVEKPDLEKLEEIIRASRGDLKVMTLAPELPGADFLIHCLRKHDIKASMGHTCATYKEAMNGFHQGITITQKTGNCMGTMHQRGMNAIGAALLDEQVMNEIISDGQTNSLDFMEICYRMKGADHLCIVSDGSTMSGMRPGIYKMENEKGNRYVVSDDGTLYYNGIPDGGSLHMLHGLRTWVEKLHIPFAEAVAMTSYNQARFLGIDTEYGSLKEGKIADFICISDDYNINCVYQKGELKYDGTHLERYENKHYSNKFSQPLPKRKEE